MFLIHSPYLSMNYSTNKRRNQTHALLDFLVFDTKIKAPSHKVIGPLDTLCSPNQTERAYRGSSSEDLLQLNKQRF